MDGRQRIAFFGGSFDPPHLGHIGVARAAQTALHLDTVLFAPVGIQPLKPLGSSAELRRSRGDDGAGHQGVAAICNLICGRA